MQSTSGTILLVHWKYNWHTLEAALKSWRTAPGAIDFVLPDRRSWFGSRPSSESDWAAAEYAWVRSDGGLFVARSDDDGATWASTTRVSTAPYARGYSPRPPCQLRDGTLLLALETHDERDHVYVLRSTDDGRTWSAPTVVHDVFPLAEPSIVAPGGGDTVHIFSRDEKTCLVHQHVSRDGGRTWAPARQTEIWGYPAHALELHDGRLLLVYGVRRPPFGIRACLSEDGGATWNYSEELVVRDDMLNANLGYPTAVQLADARVFVAYYGEDEHGVTHVMGSTFSL
jgi:hypothetical protein